MPGPLTNFPNGLTSFGAPIIPQGGSPYITGFGGPGSASQPGTNVFFVNSTVSLAFDAAGSNGTSPATPFKTLNYALTQTVNNNGDVIYVGPGHSESVTAAAGLTFPTATAVGVTVYFMGNQQERATINFPAAALTSASVTIPANNVTLINPRFLNGKDAIATAVSITGTNVTIVNGKYVDNTGFSTLIQIITTAAANQLQILGWEYIEPATAGTQKTEAIRIVGGRNHNLRNINIAGDFSTGNLNNITTAFKNATFADMFLNNLNATPHVAMAVLTTATGMAQRCVLTVASGTTGITASNVISFDKSSSMAGPGIVQPATS